MKCVSSSSIPLYSPIKFCKAFISLFLYRLWPNQEIFCSTDIQQESDQSLINWKIITPYIYCKYPSTKETNSLVFPARNVCNLCDAVVLLSWFRVWLAFFKKSSKYEILGQFKHLNRNIHIPTTIVRITNATWSLAEENTFWSWFYNGPQIKIQYCHILICGPGSSFGIATDYGLDGPRSNSGGDDIFRPSRPAMGPTYPPVKWVPGLFRG